MKKLPGENSGYEIETAGLIEEEQMTFDPGEWNCGQIKDGVTFSLGKGGWIVPFSELEEMYHAALAERNEAKELLKDVSEEEI